MDVTVLVTGETTGPAAVTRKTALPSSHLKSLTTLTRAFPPWAEGGGGNRFIELDKDGDGNVYLIIHCGSRNFGKKVCKWWQNVAAEKMADVSFSVL